MRKFNHYKVYETTLDVVYITTQLSLFAFTAMTIMSEY